MLEPWSRPKSKKTLQESSKNYNLLQEFVGYCDLHPEERFWQALLNWSGERFILAVPSNQGFTSSDSVSIFQYETFFREGKNG